MEEVTSALAASSTRRRFRGKHRGECRKPKNLRNDPERAKGMKAFDIDGVIVYAGTLKAARKKWWLLHKAEQEARHNA